MTQPRCLSYKMLKVTSVDKYQTVVVLYRVII
jgi:hypothetical protein